MSTESSNNEVAARHSHHRITKSADSSSSSSNSSCKYTGVRKRKWGKFVSEIRLPNSRERIWLGSYDSAFKAARAFDAALYCLRGPTAKFNFPDNPPEIANGRLLTPAQIQVEAARFAHSGPRVVSDPDSSSSSGSDELQQVDSPSVSDGATQVNIETGVDNTLLDQFKTMGWDSNYSVPDLSYFPSFDDFQDDLFMRPMTGPIDNEVEEPCDEFGSFLWSF
ncbi:ethylene-responsive transcription factor ERF017-like [Heracleum sosnowskyi]|uniref:Ethylene-responsive transcription factor ERF017-like n=1 Tax=Heracleum sosnowskyi TaxID=360622 RepID=A0AAD8HFB1_9APIA|nr:ethylene-responsive transcription factor ERF017-like [Heracleum sosnowskyi]